MHVTFKERALTALIVSSIMSGSFSSILFYTYLDTQDVKLTEIWLRAFSFAFPALLLIVPIVQKFSSIVCNRFM